jgi:3-hydroxyacyl-CoA dehydrogenase / enoyl-CoA hydratase / 3-hydroxybutyryl-CoA epimerase
MEPITYQVSGNVAILTFDTEGSVNALSTSVIAALGERVEQFLSDRALVGAVIASAKKDFIVGADLSMITELENWTGDRGELLEKWSSLNVVLRRLETGGKPVAAAINGSALGGGYEIALACHYRIVADDPSIRVGLPESQLGMMPAAGGTQRLPRLLGVEPACELMLTGARLTPDAALERGLVDEVVPTEELLDRAVEWVTQGPEALQPWDRTGFELPGGPVQATKGMQLFERLAAVAHASGGDYKPHVPALLTAIFRGAHSTIEVGTRVENKQHLRLLTEHLAPRRLVRTEFFGAGALRKQTSRPDEPVRTFATIGVVGAGMMGTGIAQVTAEAGLDVVLVDVSPGVLAAAREKLEQSWRREVDRGQITLDELQRRVSRVSTANDVAATADCELVIEAVTETRAVKRAVLAQISSAAPHAVIATNTSSLPVTALAEAIDDPARFIGLHFLSPVAVMPMVELVRGAGSGAPAIAAGFDFVKKLRKIAMPVGDGPAFYGTRLFLAFVTEGVALLAEGVPAPLVENAARQAGFRTGPLEVLDEVSLTLCLSTIDGQQDAESTPDAPSTTLLRKLVEQGRLGRRAGAGFYDYSKDGTSPKRLWPGLSDLVAGIDAPHPVAFGDGDDAPRLLAEHAGRRMLLAAALDAVRAREAGVVDDVSAADVGSVMAGMFPRHTGGCFSYLDDGGLTWLVEEADALAVPGRRAFVVPASLRALAEEGGAWHSSGDHRSHRLTAASRS